MKAEIQWRCWVRVFLLALLILYHSAEIWGQAPGGAAPPGGVAVPGAAPVAAPGAAPVAAPAQPAGGAAGPTFVRLTFITLDQWSFVTHPYLQITGAPDFSNGKAMAGGSYSLGTAATDVQSNSFEKLLHSLPPFGLEWGQTTDLFLPKAITVGFDYYHFYQYDTLAARNGVVPPIATDTYLYNVAIRFFAFDPGKPGINYFVGVGVGILDGVMRAKPIEGQDAEFVKFGQNPFGTTRLGLEAKGDNVGFRYELLLVNADRVHLAKNPYPGSTEKTIDFSGAIIRLAMFYHFG